MEAFFGHFLFIVLVVPFSIPGTPCLDLRYAISLPVSLAFDVVAPQRITACGRH